MNASRQGHRSLLRMIDRLKTQGISDERVLNAMSKVPRELFVETGLKFNVYDDTPLPIGFHQTISQPYIVAKMLYCLLDGRLGLGKTLEVGAGCGYQAAVLSYLAQEVYAIERIRGLLDKARNNLRHLRLANLRLKCADGYLGLPEVAPFDTIIVAAAPTEVPIALKEQLALGGRLLMPIGKESSQHLLMIERKNDEFKEYVGEKVKFVPMLTGME